MAIIKEGINMDFKIHFLLLGHRISKRYYSNKYKMNSALNTLKRKHINDDYYIEVYQKINNVWNIIEG